MATVAVQKGLEALKHELEVRGYNVKEMEKNIAPVDVVIYSGVTCEWTGGLSVQNIALEGEGQTLMINVADMNNAEAVDLVETRISNN